MMRGNVIAFDQAKGYGTARSEDGLEYFFHCTQIADGSRFIEVGTTVDFDLVPGHLGRYEASRLRRASS
jgi:cold shock CspA family protein